MKGSPVIPSSTRNTLPIPASRHAGLDPEYPPYRHAGLDPACSPYRHAGLDPASSVFDLNSGIQWRTAINKRHWIPAFAGMT